MEVEGERKWVAAPSYPDAHRCTPDYFFEVGKGGVRGGGKGRMGESPACRASPRPRRCAVPGSVPSPPTPAQGGGGDPGWAARAEHSQALGASDKDNRKKKRTN